MNGLRETCHCGHDKATHYYDRTVDPPAAYSCLATNCACERYVNEWAPKPVPVQAAKTLPPPPQINDDDYQPIPWPPSYWP